MDFTRNAEDGSFKLTGTPEEIGSLAAAASDAWGANDDLTLELQRVEGEAGGEITVQADEASDFADMIEGHDEFAALADGMHAAMEQANEDAITKAAEDRGQA